MEDRRNGFYLCLGLLFGYPKKTAWLFEKRMQLFRKVAQAPYDLIKLNSDDRDIVRHLNKNMIIVQTENRLYDDKQDPIQELNHLNSQITFVPLITTTSPFFPIQISGFVAFDEDPEDTMIQDENNRLSAKLLEILYAPNFLEIILERLSQPTSSFDVESPLIKGVEKSP